MSSTGPTNLSLIAAGIYAAVVCVCVVAAITARASHQPRAHGSSWIVLAMLFAILIALRLLDVEHVWGETVRGWMRAEGLYEKRREFQTPITLAIMAVAALVGGGWLYRATRRARGRRDIAVLLAQVAGMAMVVLIALRLTSLHLIDAALYGPLKLNWVGDLGATALVGASALYYVRAVRQRPLRAARDDRR